MKGTRSVENEAFDLEKVMEQHELGMPRSELATTFGVTEATITNRLVHLKSLEDPLDRLLANQPKEMSLLKVAVMQNITPEKLENASLDSLGRLIGMLDKVERLDKGQSTSNTQVLISHIEAVDKIKNGKDARLLDSVEVATEEDYGTESDFEEDDEELFDD